jgi:ubiquitin-like 1-activating enzyme E1 A
MWANVRERDQPNVPTKVGRETATRNIVDLTTRKDGPRVLETITKEETYVSLETAVDRALSEPFGSKFRGRKLAKVSPALPALIAYWKGQLSTENAHAAVVDMARKLGIPAGVVSEEYAKSFAENIGVEVSPVAAVVGGVLGQDILNVLGRKENPIQNLFVFEAKTCDGPIYTL